MLARFLTPLTPRPSRPTDFTALATEVEEKLAEVAARQEAQSVSQASKDRREIRKLFLAAGANGKRRITFATPLSPAIERELRDANYGVASKIGTVCKLDGGSRQYTYIEVTLPPSRPCGVSNNPPSPF